MENSSLREIQNELVAVLRVIYATTFIHSSGVALEVSTAAEDVLKKLGKFD